MNIDRPPRNVGFMAVLREPGRKPKVTARRERQQPPDGQLLADLGIRDNDTSDSIRRAMAIIEDDVSFNQLDTWANAIDGWNITPSDTIDLGSIDLP